MKRGLIAASLAFTLVACAGCPHDSSKNEQPAANQQAGAKKPLSKDQAGVDNGASAAPVNTPPPAPPPATPPPSAPGK